MGGSCICLDIKKNNFRSPEFEINQSNYEKNLQNKNDQSSLNKNNISCITNKKGNILFKAEEEKNNMLVNDINNGNSSENSKGSDNSKKKDNNLLPLNYQINNDLISNQINNEILCNNNSPSQIININRGRTSLINGVENVESATPKRGIGEVRIKEKKKNFSRFCQNK